MDDTGEPLTGHRLNTLHLKTIPLTIVLVCLDELTLKWHTQRWYITAGLRGMTLGILVLKC